METRGRWIRSTEWDERERELKYVYSKTIFRSKQLCVKIVSPTFLKKKSVKTKRGRRRQRALAKSTRRSAANCESNF